MIIGLILTVFVVALDQVSKFLVYGTAARSVIGNFLWFESTLNTGVAFSLFENNVFVFIVISAIASIIFSFLLFSKKFFKKRSLKICLGLILGGTFSNFLDRIIFDGVRDFIYLKFINFAIFNVADMAIVVGVILFCIFIVVEEFKLSSEKKQTTKEGKND